MSGFSRSPRLIKGALVTFEITSPTPKVIPFQYNPDSVSRSLQGQGTGGGEGSNVEPFRLKGPPAETITLEIELDATDRLEHPKQNAEVVEMGVYPELSALELLLYPKSESMIALTRSALSGSLEIIPPEGPYTLFVWGPKRVVPIDLTKFDITEEAFDTKLNPIRAKISLGLRILSYADLNPSHPGFSLFLAHQVSKENMSNKGTTSSLSGVGVGKTELQP